MSDTKKGHPGGLYALFFTEMWERLAFYTMVGILLLYTIDTEKGGLGLSRAAGNEIYGMYLAFVYFTPFIGGMIADRLLGYRRSVLIGGICMASGLFLMSVPGTGFFMFGLLGLIVGNGFFKPNISVMVGNLYEPGDPKRDAGFNIFYMGINIGALVANLLAAVVRNEWGWLLTFRVAGTGLVISIIILLFNWKRLEPADRQPEVGEDDAGFGEVFGKILLPAFVVGIAGYFLAKTIAPDGPVRPAVAGFLAGMVPVVIFFVRLGLKAPKTERAGLLALLPIYVAGGTFFMILHLNGSAMTQWAKYQTDRHVEWVPAPFKSEALPSYYPTAGPDTPRPNKATLAVVDDETVAKQFGLQRMDEEAVSAVLEQNPELRLETVTDEQAEGPVAARAVKVYEEVQVKQEADSHGVPVTTVSVEQGAEPIKRVAFVREVEGEEIGTFVVDDDTYEQLYEGYEEKFDEPPEQLPPGEFINTVNPEVYQSWNAFFVIVFTPLVVGVFAWLLSRKRAISTARKVFIGLVMTTLALLFMCLAGYLTGSGSLRVSGIWLAGFYAIVTIGELCLSPMGLSLVTKLTPKRLVGLTMGGWFLATAFGNNLSGFFGGIQHMMSPVAFFGLLAGLAGMAAAFILILLPWLDKVIKQYGG